eukprot:1844943-Prymnesium_polylepis.1
MILTPIRLLLGTPCHELQPGSQSRQSVGTVGQRVECQGGRRTRFRAARARCCDSEVRVVELSCVRCQLSCDTAFYAASSSPAPQHGPDPRPGVPHVGVPYSYYTSQRVSTAALAAQRIIIIGTTGGSEVARCARPHSRPTRLSPPPR